MKVHELIEWLATQDQDAEVAVAEIGYYDARVVAFNPVEHASDYREGVLLLGAIDT